MKKILIALISIAAVAAAAIAVLRFTGVISGNGLPSIKENADIEDAAQYYAEVTKRTQNEKNFTANETTVIKFKSLDTSAKTLKDMIIKLLGYEVGQQETAFESYNFVNGFLSDGSGAAPYQVMRPAGNELPNEYGGGLYLNSVSRADDDTVVSFSIKKESADGLKLMEIIKKPDGDISEFVPRHSAYLDVNGILRHIENMLTFDFSSANGGQQSGNENAANVFDVQSVTATIGDTEITAKVNENACLSQLYVSVPVTLDGKVSFMGNTINVTIRLEVTRETDFTYSGIEEE